MPFEVRPAVCGFLPDVLERVRVPQTSLTIWQRCTRRNLRVSAQTPLSRPAFTVARAGSPEITSHALYHDLLLFHWPLYADFRRLALRLASLTGSSRVRLRFEHVTNDACRKFHVDVVGLRLLCTYAGVGTEWVDAGGAVRRIVTMEVGVFKGSAYPDGAPRVLHRSPSLNTGILAGQSRLVLCIDTAP